MLPVETVFEDDHLLVVNKPSGLLSVPGRTPDLQDCLWTRLQEAVPGREVRLVHRLDRDTSGLIVFALSHEVQVALGKAFEKRKVHKAYMALVHGHLKEETGKVEGLLRKDWTRYDKPVYLLDPERGKRSLTHFEVVERREKTTLVRLRPHTGRSHQLRVHMESLGHSIVGDPIYGREGERPPLYLTSVELGLAHPVTGEDLQVKISLPDYFHPEV